MIRLLGALLLLCGVVLVGEQSYLATKAALADRLIARALAAHLEDGRIHRPWRWADTYPIGKLIVPRLGVERVILAGASGSTLAFGPGHVDGTAPPGSQGNSVLAGHRDQHTRGFAFLEQLRRGDRLVVRSTRGSRQYRVHGIEVRQADDRRILEPTETDQLTLITCYPFDGLLPSPLRYVVSASAGSD